MVSAFSHSASLGHGVKPLTLRSRSRFAVGRPRRPSRTAAVCTLRAASLACALAACTGREQTVRWPDADSAPSQPSGSTAEGKANTGAAPLAVAAPIAAPSSSPVHIEGRAVDGTGLVAVRALELACLADPAALTDPRAVRARFDSVAGSQLVPVGELAFILLSRDPARSITDPPPQLCATIAASTVLRAPLVRTREPAGRWLVRRMASGLIDDATQLVSDSAIRKLTHTGRPRVLLDDDGALMAVALPVTPGGK